MQMPLGYLFSSTLKMLVKPISIHPFLRPALPQGGDIRPTTAAALLFGGTEIAALMALSGSEGLLLTK